MRKLARRLAEANTWTHRNQRQTFASFADCWKEAFDLIQLAGLRGEYDKRVERLRKVSQ